MSFLLKEAGFLNAFCRKHKKSILPTQSLITSFFYSCECWWAALTSEHQLLSEDSQYKYHLSLNCGAQTHVDGTHDLKMDLFQAKDIKGMIC